MSNQTIPEVAEDANQLYDELVGDLDIDLDLPALDVDTDISMPEETGDIYEPIPRPSLGELSEVDLDGSGVFDVLMKSVNLHIERQHKAGRITGGDFAKVYSTSIESVLNQSIQFLLAKDRNYWEAVNAQLAAQMALIGKAEAKGRLELTRLQIQTAQYEQARIKLQALTGQNQYALSKMELVTAYNGILASENQIKLVGEQYENARAQVRDTLSDNTPVAGVLGIQRELAEAQMLTAREELDATRAQTKDTLMDGTPILGMLAIQKEVELARMEQMQVQNLLTEEQYELARAQIRDDLSDGSPIAGMAAIDKATKIAQQNLIEEQVDAARAQTKNTLKGGTQILGLLALEKQLKEAQVLSVNEQYEGLRAQVRGTLSTGEDIKGVLGAQTDLYRQQIVSYERDAESKYVKMVLDSWIARKTIDEGVNVPSQIDNPVIDSIMTKYKSNLKM